MSGRGFGKRFRFVDWTARPFHLAVQFQWEPRDLWVGVFWDFRRWSAGITGSDNKHGAYVGRPWTLHIYLCFLPMLPLHIYVERIIRPTSTSSGSAATEKTDE